MTERDSDNRKRDERTLTCPVCGAAYHPGDRFCARCGSALPADPARPERGVGPGDPGVQDEPARGAGDPAGAPPATVAGEKGAKRENAAWLLGARPGTVIVGGLLLLLLAALLLAIGQRDDTGTIVMLAICTAPLGLLTLVIGIARSIAGAARRDEDDGVSG